MSMASSPTHLEMPCFGNHAAKVSSGNPLLPRPLRTCCLSWSSFALEQYVFSQEGERKVSQPYWIQMGKGTNQTRSSNWGGKEIMMLL